MVGPRKRSDSPSHRAVVNAVWDLYAKVEGKPLWRLLADMSPEELVSCVDFTYITDAITPEEALALLRKAAPSKNERIDYLIEHGYPPTPLRPDGWAILTKKSSDSAKKRKTAALHTSRSRSDLT